MDNHLKIIFQHLWTLLCVLASATATCLGIEVANDVITVKQGDMITLECKSEYRYKSCGFKHQTLTRNRECEYELNMEKFHRDDPFPPDLKTLELNQ